MGALRQDGLADETVGPNITWLELRQSFYACGGGVEYLHRDPANHRRRRKGKSQIWESKIWSQVPSDLDPRKTALARASSIYKRQTHPLVRESAPQKQDRNCQRLINIFSLAPDGAWHQDWLIISRNVTLTLTLTLSYGSSERDTVEYSSVSGVEW
jgi:hypothetical protein